MSKRLCDLTNQTLKHYTIKSCIKVSLLQLKTMTLALRLCAVKLNLSCSVNVCCSFCFVFSALLNDLCSCSSVCKRREKLYLYAPERWSSACVEPRGVVVCNTVLFSVLMAASGLELAFCVLHLLAALLEFMCGPRFRKNKVQMFTKSLPLSKR